ncbi:MAG: PaaI family thioesterase [Acidimicrobiia bacterium]|nr:PaaI family thioesterase [Acidimicrobiia bacterium]
MQSFHDEPVRGVIGNFGLLALPGIETVRSMVTGTAAMPPIHHLTGIRPTQADPGAVTWEMPVTDWMHDRYGVIWGGVYAFFSDAVVGTALLTGLPPGKVLTTSELTLSYLRLATPDAEKLIGHGQTVHLGNSLGLSEARIEDVHGRLLAFASTRCVVIDIPGGGAAEVIPPGAPISDPVDPYLRPLPDTLNVWHEHSKYGPREVFDKQWITGELDVGPVTRMTGHRAVEMGDGTYTLEWPASPWFSAGMPAMYGGAISWALDTAVEGAIFSTLEPGEFNASIDLQVRFFRPPMLDGRTLTVRGEVQHRGHRLRVATAEMVDADGNKVATATGSAMLIPDGVEHLMAGGAAHELTPN